MSLTTTAIATGTKQLADLVDQLTKSVTDRKVRDLVLPVKEKALEVQQAALDAQREQFRIEQSHATEITNLKTEHAAEVANLKQQYAELEQAYTAFKDKALELKFGLLWDIHNNPHCSICSKPLSAITDDRKWIKCGPCGQMYEFKTASAELTLEGMQSLLEQSK